MNPRNNPPPIPNERQIQPDDPMSPDRKPPGNRQQRDKKLSDRQQQQQGAQQQQGDTVTPGDKRIRQTVKPIDDVDDDDEGRSRR